MKEFRDKMIHFKDWKSYQLFQNINKCVVVVANVLIFLLIIATVIMRYIFNLSIFGLDEVIMVVVFYVYFFGAAQGSLEDSQIRADMIGTLAKNQLIIDICHCVARFVEAAVLFICFVWSLTYIIRDFQVMAYSLVLKIPFVIAHISLLIGFFLMFLFSIAWFLRQCCITLNTMEGRDMG